MTRRSSNAIALGACLWVGCEAHPSPCDESPAQVEIGRGDAEFVVLDESDTLRLVHGPQGGIHTVMALRLHGLGERPTVELTGEIDGRRSATAVVRPDEDCTEAGMVALGIVLLWSVPPEDLDGSTATVTATASGEGGSAAEASVEILLSDDPAAAG